MVTCDQCKSSVTYKQAAIVYKKSLGKTLTLCPKCNHTFYGHEVRNVTINKQNLIIANLSDLNELKKDLETWNNTLLEIT